MKLQATRFLLLATAELPLALRKMGAATTKCRNLRLLSRLKLWKNCRTENFLDVFGFVLFRRQRKTAGEGGRGCKVQGAPERQGSAAEVRSTVQDREVCARTLFPSGCISRECKIPSYKCEPTATDGTSAPTSKTARAKQRGAISNACYDRTVVQTWKELLAMMCK